MILAILLAIYGIIFISALIYIAAAYIKRYDDRRRIAAREKYQERIDNLVDELFPPSVQPLSIQTPDLQESTVQYREAKRTMVANIRTYFNQRKIDAAIANMPGPDELAPVNPYSKLTFPSPPSLQRLLE